MREREVEMLRLKMLPPTYWNAAIFGPARSEATHVTRKQISRERVWECTESNRERARCISLRWATCVRHKFTFSDRESCLNLTRRGGPSWQQRRQQWNSQNTYNMLYPIDTQRERATDTICSYRQRSIRTALACCTGPEEILLFDPLSFPFSLTPARALLIAVSLSPTPIKT